MATQEQIRAIKDKYGEDLFRRRGVCGVGIEKDANGEFVLVVHLNDPAAQKEMPAQLDGQAVRYIASGPFRKITK